MAIVTTKDGLCLHHDVDVDRRLRSVGIVFEPWPIHPLSTESLESSLLSQYRDELDHWAEHLEHQSFIDLGLRREEGQGQQTRLYQTDTGYFCYLGACQIAVGGLEVELHEGDFLLVPAGYEHGRQARNQSPCKLLVLTGHDEDRDDFIDTWTDI